jgi:hypothetical protein
VGLTGEVAGDSHAEPGRNRGRGVAGAEGVIFALGALAEAGQAARLAQGADAVPAAGQHLMRIGLMADVPDELVVRRVEDMMQRDGQLDDAKSGAEMAPGDRNGRDQLLPELGGKLRQLMVLKPAQIRRYVDVVEQRRRTFSAHSLYPAEWGKGGKATFIGQGSRLQLPCCPGQLMLRN